MADTIVRLFDRPADALSAVRRIEALGIPHDDVSIVANNREGWYDKDGVRHDRLVSDDRRVKGDKRGMKDHDLDGGDDRLEGAGDGAMTGGVLGAGAGLLAGLGMLACARSRADRGCGMACGDGDRGCGGRCHRRRDRRHSRRADA